MRPHLGSGHGRGACGGHPQEGAKGRLALTRAHVGILRCSSVPPETGIIDAPFLPEPLPAPLPRDQPTSSERRANAERTSEHPGTPHSLCWATPPRPEVCP